VSDALHRAGIRFAPIFHGFVRHAIADALDRGASRIHYLTREGEFFKAIHDRIAEITPHRLPEAALLEVSRRSTFAASLTEVNTSSLMRIWTLYSTQSMRGLLVSLNVEAESFAHDLSRHKLTLDEAVVYPWVDTRVQAFLSDPDVAGRLAASSAEQRRLLIRYCEGHGISAGSGSVALVDIGWRGTIQDNLAHLLPSVSFSGSYLGLLRFLNPQLPTVRKIAFGPDENDIGTGSSHLLRFVTPYEMLTNSDSGSVIGYEEQRGAVRAARRRHEGEDAVYRDYTEAFQQGVLAATPALEAMPEGSPQARRQRALDLWSELAFNPPRSIAKAYLDLHHDESFGLGRSVSKAAASPLPLITRATVDVAAREKLEQHLDSTTWPAAVVKAHGVRWLALIALRRRSLEPPAGRFDQLLAQRGGRRRWRQVVQEFKGTRVCCYGAGEFASAVVRNRDLSRLNVLGFVDRDPAKVGKRIGAYDIGLPERLSEWAPDVLLVTVFRNDAVVKAVEAMVREAGLSCAVRADVWE
jgi:hypothetical protein